MTKVIWSGLSGELGGAAQEAVQLMDDVEIVAGLSRSLTGAMDVNLNPGYCCTWYRYEDVQNDLFAGAHRDCNVLVDFSDAENFDTVLMYAIRAQVALVIGTSQLSVMQLSRLQNAAQRIPVFYGGNFRFKVKRFMDEALAYAKEHPNEDLTLVEKFYEGKRLPSDTFVAVSQQIKDELGISIGLRTSATLPRENRACDWSFGNAHCHTEGFLELAHDVLRIAKIMTKKPAGEIYDLYGIWDDLLADAAEHQSA